MNFTKSVLSVLKVIGTGLSKMVVYFGFKGNLTNDGFPRTVESLPYYQAKDLSVSDAEFFFNMVCQECARESVKMPLVFVLDGKSYPVQSLVLQSDRVELRSLQ
jgi:hypothetical protein